MFTDYNRGDIPHPPKTCRHKWAFHCWFNDPLTCGRSTHNWSILIKRCNKCGKAKSQLVDIDEYVVLTAPSYAASIEEMLLGRPLTEYEAHRAETAIALN